MNASLNHLHSYSISRILNYQMIDLLNICMFVHYAVEKIKAAKDRYSPGR
jgi:hypothetical protein